MTATRATALRAVKVAHTVVWAFFVTCILAIPLVAWAGHPVASARLVGIVALEVAVLVGNRMRCPLTDLAGRYTESRQENFDIDLPRWLARHNKSIFGALYLGGALFGLVIGLKT